MKPHLRICHTETQSCRGKQYDEDALNCTILIPCQEEGGLVQLQMPQVEVFSQSGESHQDTSEI